MSEVKESVPEQYIGEADSCSYLLSFLHLILPQQASKKQTC